MNGFEQHQLENWRRGNLTTYEVKRYIKYLELNRDRDKGRLENLQRYVLEHYAGYDEWAEHRIIKLQQELVFWNKAIAFQEWLLSQPRYEMTLQNSDPYDDPVASFRQALHEVVNGQTYPIETLWDNMNDE